MTPDQVNWALRLGRCNFTPASVHKRIARSMAAQAKDDPTKPLTVKQAEYLELLVFRYRRQNGWTGEKPPFLGREASGEGIVVALPSKPMEGPSPQLSILDELIEEGKKA